MDEEYSIIELPLGGKQKDCMEVLKFSHLSSYLPVDAKVKVEITSGYSQSIVLWVCRDAVVPLLESVIKVWFNEKVSEGKENPKETSKEPVKKNGGRSVRKK